MSRKPKWVAKLQLLLHSLCQLRLLNKLGESAFAFRLSFPKTAPNSVLIRGEEGDAANMGVSYNVKLHVAENQEDFKGTKKAAVAMSVRKVSKEHRNLFH